jgi:hypothetical protein
MNDHTGACMRYNKALHSQQHSQQHDFYDASAHTAGDQCVM